MLQTKNAAPKSHNLALASLLITGLLIVGSTLSFSANKPETIDATAMGTSTQMGSQFGITLNIYDYSTPADKQRCTVQAPRLVDAGRSFQSIMSTRFQGFPIRFICKSPCLSITNSAAGYKTPVLLLLSVSFKSNSPAVKL